MKKFALKSMDPNLKCTSLTENTFFIHIFRLKIFVFVNGLNSHKQQVCAITVQTNLVLWETKLLLETEKLLLETNAVT